jgi:hypothetical protein
MTTKKCFKCNQEKELTEFYKHPKMPDGRVNKCKECNKADVRKNWWDKIDEKREYDKNRQRYSIRRIMKHRYAGIKRRCEKGGNNGRAYTVTGLNYLSQDEYEKWFYQPNNYKEFTRLYNEWVKSDFADKMSPSIDRIDPRKSYTPDNMQWLSKSENCHKYNKVITQ